MLDLDCKLEFLNTQNDVLTVGEILIDLISTEYDDNFNCDTYQKFFGGSPGNIALNVKKLGKKSAVASAVGKDGLGEYLIKSLVKDGVDTSNIQIVDYSTSLVMVTKSKSTPTPIFYRGADYNLTYTSKLEESLLNSKIIHFSCWPISMKPTRHTIEKILEIASKNKRLVGFDPNYHPLIWKNGENGIEYVKSIISKVDIVKPSDDDAERLFGKDKPENQVEKFLKLGAKLVILTLGSNGAIVSNGIETLCIDSLATKVVDTTGAGDAFWSGFYTAILKGYTVRQALSFGFAVSAYKLKYVGAVVNLPNLEGIKKLYKL